MNDKLTRVIMFLLMLTITSITIAIICIAVARKDTVLYLICCVLLIPILVSWLRLFRRD